jgi:hypothetical protein
VMAISQMSPRTEGLLMASPFFWAGSITFELANNGTRLEQHSGWALLWTAAAAVAAVLPLIATLANFDRLLSRVEGPFLTVLNSQLTQGGRRLIAAFLGFAAVATAVAIVGDHSNGSLLNAAQVSLGIVLVAALAARSAARERQTGGLDRARRAGLSARRTVLAMWLGSYGLVGPVTLLAALVVLVHETTDQAWALPVVPLVPYLLCVCAAASALGLLLGLFFSSRLAVTVTTALVGAGLSVLSYWFFSSGSPDGFWLSSPFVCVATADITGSAIGGTPGDVAWWVINWAALYGMAALAALAIAEKIVDRGGLRAATGPVDLSRHRRPAPEPKPSVGAWHE